VQKKPPCTAKPVRRSLGAKFTKSLTAPVLQGEVEVHVFNYRIHREKLRYMHLIIEFT